MNEKWEQFAEQYAKDNNIDIKPIVFARCHQDRGTITDYFLLVRNEIGSCTPYYWDLDGNRPDLGTAYYPSGKSAAESISKLHDMFRDRQVVCFDAENTFYPLRSLFVSCNGIEPRFDLIDLQQISQELFKDKKYFDLRAVAGYFDFDVSSNDTIVEETRSINSIYDKLDNLGMI